LGPRPVVGEAVVEPLVDHVALWEPYFQGVGSRVSGMGPREREFFIDNLLVRIHFIIEMIWWTGLAPWKFELPFPGSLIYTFLVEEEKGLGPRPVVGEAVVEPLVEHVALWEPHFLELRVEGLGFNLLWG